MAIIRFAFPGRCPSVGGIPRPTRRRFADAVDGAEKKKGFRLLVRPLYSRLTSRLRVDSRTIRLATSKRFDAGRKEGTVKVFASSVRAFLNDDSGPTATEYAVLLAVIAITALGTMALFGTRVEGIYTTINNAVGIL